MPNNTFFYELAYLMIEAQSHMPPDSTFPPSLDEIIEEFDELEDWEERYEFLIEMGRDLPPLEADLMCEKNLVHGCMSTVWLVVESSQGDVLEVRADSDSLIVKGLIVVLLAAFNHRTPDEIVHFDTQQLFDRLGLSQHLSANRRNGLFAMVQRARQLAVELSA